MFIFRWAIKAIIILVLLFSMLWALIPSPVVESAWQQNPHAMVKVECRAVNEF